MILKRFLTLQVAAIQLVVDPGGLNPTSFDRQIHRLGNREDPDAA
jgi:hypothetical protein